MVIVQLMGGLGNQLFQYAAGKLLADYHKVELRYIFSEFYPYAKRELMITHFNISGMSIGREEAKGYLPKRKIARRINKLLGLNYEGRKYSERVEFRFDREFFNVPNKTYLWGFWQSFKYLEKIEDILRKEISIRAPSKQFISASEKLSGLHNPIAFHIRRGDYLNIKSGFNILPNSYYLDSAQLLKNEIGSFTAIVFSDDQNWVKQNISFLDQLVFASDFGLNDYEELILMSKCKHQVIANSSYSWWGAWLNSNPDKVVIAPMNWHRLHDSQSELLLPEWIKLNF